MMRFIQVTLIVAGCSGAIAVLMGAYAAHGLAAHFPNAVETVKTAAHYQLVHTVAVLALAFALLRTPSQIAVKFAICAFMLGILLFSGSLYALAFGGSRVFGPITPLGGLLLVAGWLSMIWAGVNVQRSNFFPHS